jgi:hypothetical protein
MKRWKEVLMVSLIALISGLAVHVAKANWYDWRQYFEVSHSDRYNGTWTYYAGWIYQGTYYGPWYQERDEWGEGWTNHGTNFWYEWPAFAKHSLSWTYGQNNCGSCAENSKWEVQNINETGDYRYLHLDGIYLDTSSDHNGSGQQLDYSSLFSESYVGCNTYLVYYGPSTGHYRATVGAGILPYQ